MRRRRGGGCRGIMMLRRMRRMVMTIAAMLALTRQNGDQNCAAGMDQIRIGNSMAGGTNDIAAVIIAPDTRPLRTMAEVFVGNRPERIAHLDLISCADHTFPPCVA